MLVNLTVAAAVAQDHGHLNVGANGTTLTWDNGADFNPETGFVRTLSFTNGGKYANFYQGNITLTAMHSRHPIDNELDPVAPKPGAFIVGEIVSVKGPEGGAFAFWENTSTPGTPTVSIPAGTTNAGFQFEVSESGLGAGQADGDAYGHIHGRRFTATIPGVYTVGFRAHDTSTNGPNGGPIHTSTPIQYVQFQAGVVLRAIERSATGTIVSLGAQGGYSWQLQFTENLAAPNWQNVGDPVAGDDAFVGIQDPATVSSHRFYRAVGTLVLP